jgi:5-formyltetrahydrofolate cyclo-ligase
VPVEEAKWRLRKEMRELRRRLSDAERAEIGDAIARNVLAFDGLRSGRRVALYSALPDEVPTDGLMRELLRRRQPVLLPRASSGGDLEFAACVDPSTLVRGRFGALEPGAGEPSQRLAPDDLILVPGVAFDERGGRLGRGGGWYDRSLPGDVQTLFGIAFHFQLVGLVPVTAHDRRVAGVFTERGLHRCDPGS